jgi:cellulose synthase/poly-beta-1,6-N-acetylglucosamine synthase-like glycosyltransferase
MDGLALVMVNALFGVVAVGLAVPIAVFFIECCAAMFPTRVGRAAELTERPQVVVLIPAHNEAAGIGATLETILPQLVENDRVVLVADNCSDDTAEIARHFGVTVLERQDAERRGKGYALNFGLQFLAHDPPEVMVMIDADCRVAPGMIDRIVRLAMATERPIQATYLMECPPHPTPKDAISALAFQVKNWVRPQGLARFGFPCLLTGTGMAFPWSVICQVSLDGGNLVEDMQLGLDLAVAGYAPIFSPEACVMGVLPQQEKAAKNQRTRWEHGHLQTLRSQVPRLLRAAINQRRGDLLALALDLCVPPLSLLVVIWVAATGGTLLAGLGGAGWQPALWLAVQGLVLVTAIFGAWVKFGRSDIPLHLLLAIPIYILWKIPLYLGFLIRPQQQWVRTERD